VDFSWLNDAISGLPPELRFVVIIVVLGLVYKGIDLKFIQPSTNGNDDGIDIQDQIANIELHVTNHLAHEMQDLKTAIQDLSVSIRDMTEQLNRNVNSMNIVLNKQDAMRDILIEIKGKING
jgi:hypothetical protein